MKPPAKTPCVKCGAFNVILAIAAIDFGHAVVVMNFRPKPSLFNRAQTSTPWAELKRPLKKFMLKFSLLVFLSLTCLHLSIAAPAEVKRCVFSIEVIRDGGGMYPKRYTAVGDGIFLYEHADGRISGERYQRLEPNDGARRVPEREIFGAGPEFTRRIRDLFKKSALRERDFQAAVIAAQQPRSDGKIFMVTGAKTERVFADLEGTQFDFSTPGIGWLLKNLADDNAKLRALKSLLDGVAFEYGRSRIFIEPY